MKDISTPRQIGAAIREERLRKGLTQQQLADLSGVSRGFVNRLEKGSAAAVYPDKLLAVLTAVGLRMVLVGIGESHGDAGATSPQQAKRPLSPTQALQSNPSIGMLREIGRDSEALPPQFFATAKEALELAQANLNLSATSPLLAPREPATVPSVVKGESR